MKEEKYRKIEKLIFDPKKYESKEQAERRKKIYERIKQASEIMERIKQASEIIKS